MKLHYYTRKRGGKMEERKAAERTNNKACHEESERIISIVRLVSDDFAVTKAAANRFQPDNKVHLSPSTPSPAVTKTLYPSSAGITRLRFCIADFKETTCTGKVYKHNEPRSGKRSKARFPPSSVISLGVAFSFRV